ncbi:MAG TPA: DUF3006 domain-containing protein [Ruminiclostridium sp.]|nr:DUF3006 domain-containing protein [Ruminiclostridium sp.]
MEISMEHLKEYVLDRFEGEYAILEDNSGRMFDVLREELPLDLKEGDVLHENAGEFVVDEKATADKREKLKKIFDNLVKKY